MALNAALGKLTSTTPESVAPENPQQDASADGYNSNTLTQASRSPCP